MHKNNHEVRAVRDVQCSIIRFVRRREQTIRAEGLEPLQYEFLMLVEPFHQQARKPNISRVATELGMHHHSAVELVNRLIKRGLLRKDRDKRDKRHALLQATARGKRLLRQAILTEYAEMREFAPELLQNLKLFLKQRRVLANSAGSKS